MIEGTIIAGLAIGAKMGFIYLRGEYRYLLKIMEKAVADAYAKGFLGKNIFGAATEFEVVTQTGAGAYEVGEESALMESLEGKRGHSAHPSSLPCRCRALWRADDHQQCGDDCECAAGDRDGRGGLREVGTERNGGTRLFCLSGHVERPGVYELPMGYNLKKMIYEVGGGIRGGRKLKAVVPGGSSTPVLLPEEIENGNGFRPGGQGGIDAGVGRRGGD